jgi:hypothetical protein
VSYGWNGFTTLQDAPDRNGRDFLDFYLESMRAAESSAGRRLLDVLDLHWYPEARGGGVRITENSTAADVVTARLQAPRSLWDPAYVESSWISQDAGVGAIRLLPRMKEKIAARYPGTRVAITEWSYGGGGDVSGALAHADALGIFGREDVFAAARWDLGADQAFADAAFEAYCNYDGQGGRFGDTSVSAVTSDAARASVFASVSSADAGLLVLVAINKSTGPTTAELDVSGGPAWTAGRTYWITAEAARLVPGPDLAPGEALEMPPRSLAVVVLTTGS